MTYVLKLRDAPNNPAMTITINRTSAPSDDPTAQMWWKAHAQYDDSTRQASANFTAINDARLFDILTRAMHALDVAF